MRLAPGRPAPPVAAGGRLRLVAPAGVVEAADVEASASALRGLGFEVEVPWGLVRRSASAPYLAGEDAARAQELVSALVEPGVEGVVCVRGGYGAMRLLRLLDGRLGAPLRRASPRLLVGFSDITALHGYLLRRLGWASLHGPLGKTLAAGDGWSAAQLGASLRGEAARVRLEGLEGVCAGRGEGVLVGGNLSLVCALVGTRWWPSLRGAVLFLEEVGEAAYRVDRLLTELELRGVLGGLAGLVVGSLGVGGDRYGDAAQGEASLRGRVEALMAGRGIPVAWGLPVGHGVRNATLAVGRRAWLVCADGEASLEFEAASSLESPGDT